MDKEDFVAFKVESSEAVKNTDCGTTVNLFPCPRPHLGIGVILLNPMAKS